MIRDPIAEAQVEQERLSCGCSIWVLLILAAFLVGAALVYFFGGHA